MKALIAQKVGMTSIVADNGALLPVTLLVAEPNTVTHVKTSETDGYTAVQLGFGTDKNVTKPQAGHLKKANVSSKVTREFRDMTEAEELKVGDNVSVEVFEPGDVVHVTGTSKGKGFAGTIKRHNFKRGRKTHGGRSYRRVGSIGSMYPQKIFKGKRMSGHMGDEQVTTRNLKVALVDVENNVIGIVGAVPGPKKGIVFLKGAK